MITPPDMKLKKSVDLFKKKKKCLEKLSWIFSKIYLIIVEITTDLKNFFVLCLSSNKIQLHSVLLQFKGHCGISMQTSTLIGRIRYWWIICIVLEPFSLLHLHK